MMLYKLVVEGKLRGNDASTPYGISYVQYRCMYVVRKPKLLCFGCGDRWRHWHFSKHCVVCTRTQW